MDLASQALRNFFTVRSSFFPSLDIDGKQIMEEIQNFVNLNSIMNTEWLKTLFSALYWHASIIRNPGALWFPIYIQPSFQFAHVLKVLMAPALPVALAVGATQNTRQQYDQTAD